MFFLGIETRLKIQNNFLGDFGQVTTISFFFLKSLRKIRKTLRSFRNVFQKKKKIVNLSARENWCRRKPVLHPFLVNSAQGWASGAEKPLKNKKSEKCIRKSSILRKKWVQGHWGYFGPRGAFNSKNLKIGQKS